MVSRAFRQITKCKTQFQIGTQEVRSRLIGTVPQKRDFPFQSIHVAEITPILSKVKRGKTVGYCLWLAAQCDRPSKSVAVPSFVPTTERYDLLQMFELRP
jgi:hypothetical protein